MRKSWDTIKHLLGKQNNQTKVKEMLINDEIVYDESQIASGLNEYFSTIGSKLDQQLPAHTTFIPVRHQSRTVPSFFIFPVTHEECLKIIKSLKNSKSGVDCIPVRLFKAISPYIVNPLTYIINQALSEGTFPDHLKIARVTPILKKRCDLGSL